MTLVDLISRARCLLVDFDGPICAVFAGYPTTTVAAQLQAIVRQYLNGDLPPEIAALSASPLQILRQVADLEDDALTRAIADTCRDAEITAVAAATPTPGAGDLLRVAHEASRRIAIVSNNSTAAIETYLRVNDLARYVDAIAARNDDLDPRLLKPHPFLLERALTAAHASRDEGVFIGDSTTDIEAGRAVGIATIGYANKPGKYERLTDAGADVVIDTMYAVASAVRAATTGSFR